MKLLVLIPFIIIIGDSSCTTGPKSPSQLIAEIIDAYYVLRQVPLLFTGEPKQIQLDLINGIIRNFRYPRVIQLDPTAIGEYSSWSYVIFFQENYDSFQPRLDQLNSEQYDLFGYYTFVFYQVNETEITNIFNAIWELKIIRAVIIDVSDNEPQLYNYSPYLNNRCGKPTANHIQNWTSTELFMYRLKNFYSCPLKLGTFQSPPFMDIQTGPSRQTVIAGFEGDLVTTLSELLNFKVIVITPPDNGEWGEPRPKNSTGLMGVLQNGLAHFGIGCLGIAQLRNEILQPGRPHYTSRVLFAVPEGRPLSSFEKLFRPLQNVVWYSFGSLIGSTAVLVMILKFAPDKVRIFIYGKGSGTPFLNFFNIIYTGVLHKLPRRNFARTLLILWIVHCFIVRTLYQGSLFKYLQAESNHQPIGTLNEIEQSDLYYYFFKVSERFFQNNSRVLSRVRHLEPGNDTLNGMMDALGTRKLHDGVLMITLEHLAYHNKHRLDHGFVRCTRDAISSYPMVIYYPKRTFLVRVLNRVIGQIEASGLMDFWVQRNGNYEFFPKTNTGGHPTALSNHHLMGCYQSACVMWIIAFWLFALEMMSVKIVTLRRFLEFLADK